MAPWLLANKMAITFYRMHASPWFFHTITTVSDAMYRQQIVISLRNNFQFTGKKHGGVQCLKVWWEKY